MADTTQDLVVIPSLTYQVNNGRIIGKVDGMDAMKQAIFKILNTERFIFPIYSDQYGSDVNDYIGKDINYFMAVIGDVIKEALLADDRVIDVTLNSLTQTDKQSLTASLTVSTTWGQIDTETEVST